MNNVKTIILSLAVCLFANLLSIRKSGNLLKFGFPQIFYESSTSTTSIGEGTVHRFFLISLLVNLAAFILAGLILKLIIRGLRRNSAAAK